MIIESSQECNHWLAENIYPESRVSQKNKHLMTLIFSMPVIQNALNESNDCILHIKSERSISRLKLRGNFTRVINVARPNSW